MELYLLLGFAIGILFTLFTEVIAFMLILRWAMKQQKEAQKEKINTAIDLATSMTQAQKGVQG